MYLRGPFTSFFKLHFLYFILLLAVLVLVAAWALLSLQ